MIPTRLFAIALTASLSCGDVLGREREVVRCDWTTLDQQIKARHLGGGKARIRLAGGAEIQAKVLGVAGAGLRVHENRATRQWKTAGGEAVVPKEQAASLRFEGRKGKGRLIGTLAGAGAGAGIGAAIVTGTDVDEGWFFIIIPVAAVAIAIIGGVAGYFTGRAFDTPNPEFILTP
jgi:hypothetical protein